MSEGTARITLIGFMGSGKSSVGRELARMLKADLVDLDAEIEKAAGKAIATIFHDEGEGAFRAMERRALFETLAPKSAVRPVVLCSGGGIVLDPRNVADIRAAGIVVWLRASAETVLERVAGDRSRPLLRGAMNLEKIAGLMAARRDKYAEAATFSIATDGKSPREIAEEIAEEIRRLPAPPPL
jgi:shikimate kinase